MQPLASVALTMIGNVPAWVGVPSRTPVAVWKVRPVGSAPLSDHRIGKEPPLCVNVCEKAAPAEPVVVAGFVTVMVGQVIVNEKF